MLDYLIAVILIGLATNRVVECWWHSSLFHLFRYAFKIKLIQFPMSGAFTCPFCFSFHAALWLTVITIYGFDLNWWALPIMWFSSVYVANQLNDSLKTKTPRENYSEDLELAKGEADATK